MNYIDETMSCGCTIRMIELGATQIKKLCPYHKFKTNQPDLLINFHNWSVDRLNSLREVLESLK